MVPQCICKTNTEPTLLQIFVQKNIVWEHSELIGFLFLRKHALEPEDIVLSEISQAQSQTLYILTYMWKLKQVE
jgi:hypothetical protein